MKRMLTALFICAVLTPGCGGQPDNDDPPAEAKVDESVSLAIHANDAAGEVSAVSYGFHFYGTGYLESEVAFLSGVVDLSRPSDGESYIARLAFDSCGPGGYVPVPSVYAMDGTTAFVLNRRDSVFTTAALSQGGADLFNFSGRLVMLEFVIDDPFADEIGADSLALLGTETVAGVECDVVYVRYESGPSIAKWFFGVDDHLPRKVIRIYDSDTETGSLVLELTSLSFPEAFPEGHFTLTSPDGFTMEEFNAFLPVGEKAPDWTLMDPDGNLVSLADLRGSVVVMDFWATWCGPCRQVMPSLQAMAIQHQDQQLEVIGVNVWENDDPVAFMQEEGYTYRIVLDGDLVADEYLVTGIPTFYVIDAEGNIAFAAKGSNPENEVALSAMVASLLAE